MKVIVVKCDECGRLGTNDLKWIKVTAEAVPRKTAVEEEVLLCVCGNRKWKFKEMDTMGIGPDVLVIQKAE